MWIQKNKEELEKAFEQWKSLPKKEQTFNRYSFLLNLSINNYWKFYYQCLNNQSTLSEIALNYHNLVITLINSNIEEKMITRNEKIAIAWMKKNNANLYNFDDKEEKEENIKIEVNLQPFKINE